MTPAFSLTIKKLIFSFFLILSSLNLVGDDIFPPFYSREKKTEGDKTVEKISLRPLFTVYRSIDPNNAFIFEQLQLLWPFFFYQKTNDRRFFRFFPLAYSTDKFQDYGTDTDNWILPFLTWGSDPKEGKYFVLLPFGGVDKGHLGKEKIVFILFPLYFRSEYKGFISTNYAFPFVQTNRGNKHDGWRFWPFYGTYKIFKDDANTQLIEDRKFAFWPFWIKQNRYNENGSVGKSIVSFPFYGRYTSNSKNELMIMWPLYKKVNFPKENGTFYTFIWPFFKFGKSDTADRFEFFPLYGYKRNENFKRQFVLWPFIRHEKDDNKYEKLHRFWFMPFLWTSHYTDKKTELDRRKVKIWPLLQYKREADGLRKFEIFSPFWFNDSVKGGFENNYADFFRIFHTQYKKKESYHTKLLFNLIQFQKGKDTRKIRVFPFIYRYEKTPEKKKVSILAGLVEYSRDTERKGFKILWIPFSRQTR